MTALLSPPGPPAPARRPRRRTWLVLGVVAALLAATGVWLLRPDPLLFEDDFNGDALDTGTWSTCFFTQESHCTNDYNDELQVFTPEGVVLRDGALRLTAREEQTEGETQAGDPVTLPYSSGMVTTEGEFSFQYGYVEFAARVPEGRGLWSALWLLPEARTWPPEIDVMESIGSEPDRVHLTVHAPDREQQSETVVGPDFSAGVHRYGVDWQPGRLTWYVDGEERFTVTEGVPDEPMYLVATLSVGGSWPGAPDDATRFPAEFALHGVQVWADRLDSPTFAEEAAAREDRT